MLTRRGFVALTATGVTGIGVIGGTQRDEPKARILLELVNDAEVDAKHTVSIKSTDEETSQQRESRLSAGERTHYHLPIQAGTTYEITGQARITIDDATVEGFRTTSSTADISFQIPSTTKRATLRRGTRVTVHLTPSQDIEIGLLQDE